MKKLEVLKGFTIIELMVAVAIIGILVSMALPSFQDYLIRARVSEGLSLATSAKLQVLEVLSGGNPNANTQGYAQGYTPPSATKNIASLQISPNTGVITITTTPAAGKASFHLVPFLGTLDNPSALPDAQASFTPPEQANVQWRCVVTGVRVPADIPIPSGDLLATKYAPGECK